MTHRIPVTLLQILDFCQDHGIETDLYQSSPIKEFQQVLKKHYNARLKEEWLNEANVWTRYLEFDDPKLTVFFQLKYL